MLNLRVPTIDCNGRSTSSRHLHLILSALGVMTMLLSTASVVQARPYLRFTRVASTGDTTVDGYKLNSFKPQVSVNGQGDVAFISAISNTSSSGNGVIAGLNAFGSYVTDLISFNPTNNRTYSFPQINNDNRVLAIDSINGDYIVRTWPIFSGSFPIIIKSTTNNQFDLLTTPARSDSAMTCFIGDSSIRPQALYINTTGVRDAEKFIVSDLEGGVFRPTIDGAGAIVLREGTGGDGSLVRFLGTTTTTIATAPGDWSNLGRSPNLTEDGNLLAFYGQPTGEPEGIFIYALTALPQLNPFTRLCIPVGSSTFGPGDMQWTKWTTTPDPDLCTDVQIDYRLTDKSEIFSTRITSLVPDHEVNIAQIYEATDFSIYRVAFKANVSIGKNASIQSGEGIFTMQIKLSGGLVTVISGPHYVAGSVSSINFETDPPSSIFPSSVSLYDGVSGGSEDCLAFYATSSDGKQHVIVAHPVVEPMRQNQQPWGNVLYAGNKFANYAASLPASDTRRETMNNIVSKNAYTISAKGCVLASLAMAINALQKYNTPNANDRDFLTPLDVHSRLLNGGLINNVKKPYTCTPVPPHLWRHSFATRLPVLDGPDLEAYRTGMRTALGIQPKHKHIRVVAPLDSAGMSTLWDYLMGNEPGAPTIGERAARAAIITKGGHRVPAIGISNLGAATRSVFVIETYLGRTETGMPSFKDYKFDSSDFTSFASTYKGATDAYKIELVNAATPASLRDLEGEMSPMSDPPQDPAGEISVTILGPPNLDFVVSMPNGDRAGCDPFTGIVYGEIAQSVYYNEPPIYEAEGLDTLPPAELAEINAEGPRFFHWTGSGQNEVGVQAFGTENFGEVEIEMIVSDDNGPISTRIETVTVNQGSSPTIMIPINSGGTSGESIKITSTSFDGSTFTVEFLGEAGVSDWRIMASTDMNGFPINRTGDATINEIEAGRYRAVIPIAAGTDRYFIRIERP